MSNQPVDPFWLFKAHQNEPHEKGIIIFRSLRDYRLFMNPKEADTSELLRDYTFYLMPPENLIPQILTNPEDTIPDFQ